ncbi:nuclear pore membrane glycoprotein 210 [Tribolium castaneum]|uniref:nuclear pore membrane glycoprotein 210 n=1 Tax=Tribolium castaneum TaxID=7070 RepID=UPI0030FEDB8A
MAGAKIITCIFYTLFIASAFSSKLNVPRVLLPIFNDFSMKFLLEANDGGCYKWSTTRNDIIKLTMLDENLDLHCSIKAEVQTVTKEPVRNLAVVLAEDVQTDQILKCDVVVDAISSLSITTTTRELFMEEVPEAFQVNAYDAQGNEFSSLEGVEFDWKIITLGSKKEAVVVRYLPFKDSPYESLPHIQKLEDDNRKGSVILLEGVKTGSAKVSVRLPYSEYKEVPSIEVVLTVIANLLLVPSEAYMMEGDVISFKLYYMHNGKMDELQIPDAQYFLESEDESVVKSDKSSREVTARALGKCHVMLRSSNRLDDDPALKLPVAVITVVQPSYIVLTLLPHKNWAILVGDQHEIIAEVYSSSDNKLYLGSGVQIQTQVGEAFHVEERSQNGSWISGWGLKESRAIVSAKLEAVIHPTLGKFTLDTPIISQGELYIYPRITISPAEVVLPWDTQIKPKYDIDLVAKGGDGRFLWSSTDHSIGIVSQTGHVRTLTQGYFSVSAAMTRNHHNRQYAKFSILPPVRLEIVEFIMEAEIFQPIYLHIALYAPKTSNDNTTQTFIPFTQCQDLPFQVKQTDNKFIYNKTASIPPVGISCGNIAMIGTAVGTSKVTVTYYQDGLILEDSVTINAYYPLKLISPSPKHQVVLAVGSAIHLVFSGGPRPQIGRQSDHQRIVIVENEATVQAEDVTDSNQLPLEDITAVWVLCRKLGETNVKLTISNTPSLPNCKSHGSTVTTKVICGKPRRLHIQPEVKVNDAKACPMDLSADRVVVPNNQDIELEVVVIDELGRVFLNTSSLLFTWESRPAGEVKFQSIDSTITKHEMFGSVPLVNKTLQIIRPYIDSGLLEVTGTVKGYKMSVLKAYHITPEWPEFLSGEERSADHPAITATVGLFLVDDTVVTPNVTIIFNQPNVKKEIAVMHGSGYIELSLSNDEIATVNYVEGTRLIEIVPVVSGEMTIQVVDLCLVANPIFIYVKVVSLGKIEVETAGKVEINHCIQVVAKLYDETDQLLDVHDMGVIELRHRFSKNIANLGRMPQNADDPWPLGEVHFVLTGVELGDAQLTFTFDNKDQVVSSEPVDIQVFPPLKVNPRNGTLLVGATMQLTLRGGPQPDTSIEFEPHTNGTITVSDVGIVVGKNLGFTKITVRSIGVHPKTGEKIIYAEDTIDVNIVKISGVKIGAPLTKFKSGGTIPVWVTGIPETISPLILSSFEDSALTYDWYFNDFDVTTLVGVFSTVGVIYKTCDKTIVRVTGLQPGKTKLYVNVTFNAVDATQPTVYQAYVDLEVFEPLMLVTPRHMPGRSLLMARHSSIQLQTNLEGIVNIEYSIPEFRLTGTEVTAMNSTPVATITVTETGYLQSFGTVGFAQLLITATDELGLKQTLTYVVEVKPVHYMLLTVKANWRIHLDSSLQVIPLGTEFDLVANFYDIIGNKFNAGPRQVKVRANRLDLVKIKQYTSNATMTVATKKPGHTVIKAWTDGVDNTADYVKIHSKEVVKPVVDFLTSGDIMCLWSPVVTRHLQIGFWSSSDTSMISIDATIDLAFVIGNKEGTVLLTHSLQANVPLRMQVLPVAEVKLYPDKVTFFTNGAEGMVQRIGVVLKSRVGPADKRNNLIQGWLCDRSFHRYLVPTPFRCFVRFTNESVDIDANSIFSMKSSFKPEIGQYNCKIISTGANTSDVSLLMTNITFWVISDEGEIESQPLEMPFIPTPYVPPEVYIGDQGNVGELVVTGLGYILEHIVVQPADSSIVYVDKGRLIDENHKMYQVQLVDYHPKFADQEDVMGIIVRSPLTDQATQVMVRVSNKYRDDTCAGKSPIYRFIQHYKHAIIIVISMLIIFCVTCYVYSRYMQPMVTVTVNPNRSLLNASYQQQHYPTASTPMNMMNRTQPSIPRLSPTSPICTSKSNCTCGRNREPVYGDVSSFTMNSPELRRNRRFL